ncbi:MAG: MotA/TolQ/ExbB proton channel family protein [Henriciella sp.]
MLGLEDLQEFLSRGGPVLLAIMATTFLMWSLILERLFYFRLAHQTYAKRALAQWQARSDHRSTFAHWIKDKIVSEVRQKAQANVGFTKALVALAPLLGLLGTVTGMVTVFDYMAITDGADAKAMSRGVSQATIPTMAGMVASISGILFTSGMDQKVERLIQKLNDEMGVE